MQPNYSQEPAIEAALTDLVRLAQYIRGSFAAPQETLQVLASELLKRLLTFSHAQRGAWILCAPGSVQTSYQADAFQTMAPIAAFSRFQPQEVQQLLKLRSREEEFESLPLETPTLLWHRTIQLPLQSQQQDASSQSYIQWEGFFFLEWGSDGRDLLLKTQALLPYLADIIDALLLDMLLIRRMHDLEELAYQRSEQKIEFLKAELLATVSHELRGPLASIQGYATTLLRHDQQITRQERHEFLVAINQAGKRLERIVGQLLEISQLETQIHPFSPDAVNLIYVIQESILNVQQALEQESKMRKKELQPIVYRFPRPEKGDEFVVDGDRRLLCDIFEHVLENAARYSPGGGTVEIGMQHVGLESFPSLAERSGHRRVIVVPAMPPEETAWVEICVKDEGMGIAPEHMERIFDRFYRVDTRMTREVDGLGLGLAICKHVVALHRGGLWVESGQGQGSTFHILLPQWRGSRG
ncbi:phospho-acceptor domain-containing protein [Thermosporothrix hazakensis]|jgi:signal transduction histidine kinase|uniref:histidine kinase n=2 Tax=Thermosporothrix TaxID=768650 RepID=A0A326U618_THEHA|nr:ATP-binding protein [Thermosporothrix hazakensis]PZW29416.1 phospho-acceptor domain-containing protein [Thermosporothrix hazakensis]BBH85704.1 hypothetical protein KTC_04550 [Thermosporothrix sp. COM3]GCE45867.1 hypothetical protein KTH_07360 [Thermosporothrix hazakensis]